MDELILDGLVMGLNFVRIGVVGLGNMGTMHAKDLYEGKVQGAKLTAVMDMREERLNLAQHEFGDSVLRFQDEDSFYASGAMDAVIIATPHYDHPRAAMKASGSGLHVLIEKPAGVYTKHVREMNEAARQSGKVFAIMYNQRTNPLYLKVRDLVQSGELGDIRRMNWIITNWYRPQGYYDSGAWRATWAGEGGGVLINQCPHQLDLWQWMTGMMPQRIRAFCHFGKHRNIEVEDEVTAYAEYENGATAVFVTTTAEAAGANRFELVGTRGRIVVEDAKLTFWRLRISEPEFNQQFKGSFGEPEHWKCDIPIKGKETGHRGIMQNFVDAILRDAPLIAKGEEGIHGLTLSNAMYLSTWQDDWVNLPLDEELFHELLQQKIKESSSTKTLLTEVGK